MALCSAFIAVMEVSLFGFLGNIVDWLSQESPETFLKTQGTRFALIGVVVLVLLPFVVAVHAMNIHQTLIGNFPMRGSGGLSTVICWGSLSVISRMNLPAVSPPKWCRLRWPCVKR